ncbi:rhomboid family intramembrane serine protease [Tenacibaculum sp. Bg11-29]|uniref:rhomboid family intramembrane serine protease n=1 Tax=Tenacibaculum sp. Bg11-29 TaxID=2058306 RepID=UPI000C32A680|nr:rhomboid family intramembrane serine protease [Tenacibaculum sp. Bg11-29]PKH52560.1 rhomboid family intramembrane serine protease [Tenacibaculum sp. Bg11-29]
MGKLTDAIKHLIIINVIMYFAPQFLNLDLTNIFALHYPQNEHFGVWQYVTHTFMHGSTMHLLFNMYALWAFGTPLEQMWGRNKFLFFYFSAGIGAGLIYTLVNYYQFNGIYEQLVTLGISPSEIQNVLNTGQYNDDIITLSNKTMSEFYSLYHTPAVGASGAVYGILVAFGLTFPNAKLALIFFPVPIAAKYFIPLMIASDLFFGVTKYSIGNVAHFAHIGGALIGFIIAWYWRKKQLKSY